MEPGFHYYLDLPKGQEAKQELKMEKEAERPLFFMPKK